MKKLLLILAFLPLIGISQLSDYYYFSNGNPKTNGLEFSIKKPLGYEQMSGGISTTIVKFSKLNEKITKEIIISIYTLEEAGLEDMRNVSKSELKEFFGSSENEQYYELCGYPGWIAEDGFNNFRSLQSFTIINNNIFVMKASIMQKHIPYELEALFYKMSKTLEFLEE